MLSGARARSHGSDPQAGESARHEEVSAGAPVPGRPFPDPALRHGRLLLARHAAALLALVLAYLQYNFFEVHLVIESLPSIVVYLPPW